jgi:tetratricopeptide (TPR) repeat protein
MSAEMNVLSEQVVKKSFKDCSIEELQKLTADFPYFAPAHFLLLKKLDPVTEAYRKQYQKAILYFNDPLSFEYFINRSSFDTPFEPIPDTQDEQVPTETMYEEPAAAEVSSTISPAADTTAPLAFEPYHTVDYFASQGIKLSVEDVSNDKFGKQLKSFTDWLKTMKRLPVAVPGTTDPANEQKVENLAVHSVEESDVTTESMAEVWLKQGNKEKAIELYRKLSLLDPSKNAYFAAKIESLKE